MLQLRVSLLSTTPVTSMSKRTQPWPSSLGLADRAPQQFRFRAAWKTQQGFRRGSAIGHDADARAADVLRQGGEGPRDVGRFVAHRNDQDAHGQLGPRLPVRLFDLLSFPSPSRWVRAARSWRASAVSERLSTATCMGLLTHNGCETLGSALLPAMTRIIQDKNGSVTEYLGDGLLALFQLPQNRNEQDSILGDVITAAKRCMDGLQEVVNPVLSNRYSLPNLEIGIGLSYSDAIISHFGLHPNTQIKVIGECIYLASQLSKGRNEIIIHENLEMVWPTSKSGTLRFKMKQFKDFKGYVLEPWEG